MKKRIGSRQILLLIMLFLVALIPMFIKTPYILSILVMTFYTASASLAWSILGGMTGQISLGHAAFMGLGAYISTLLLMNANFTPWVSIIVVFFVVGGISALLLSPCFHLRGPYFSLVTIAFGEAFRNLLTNWNYAGKGQGLLLPFGDNSLILMRFKSKAPYFYLALVMVILMYLLVKYIDQSKLGYALKTVREDEDTANAIGINPWKYKVIATFISCGLVAVCGVFYASYIRFISPDIMMQDQSVKFVLPAVIGGIGSAIGPLIGAIILTPLSEYLNATLSSIAPGANLLVYAVILIVVILFQPRGIMGWYENSKFKIKLNNWLDKLDGRKKE
ncbi:amino acid/amide ABC transporter membrane protein 2 (HAAT family) [Lachnotalea glycerini]|uniref:Amino acid/amide ABC transporter membrane protein 2 (HAAT family) n=1 Tax=Lachnotalea glycerini TaxID=1763509 RepID=A0A255JER5_9FIRM|nr:branched-chain amino acid ABC transporter permease [Lachnotalea glycerini]OYO51098.1 branched-chain amino acid ABC transporter permease [Lachnotalea glycerini]PXV91620.1 amino acid/amide ABC transporter membrane protein 2 (HAAT family) [Lachnotalea glycerini]RDY28450.1 branched-chain amino acid ABC transporter permease [Lachnotalea glycerini]